MAPGFLGLLSEADRDLLLKGARRLTFPAGSLAPGHPERRLAALIEDGMVRIFVMAPDGRQVSIAYLHRDDAYGTPKLLGPPPPVQLQAVTETTVQLIDSEQLDRLTDANMRITSAVMSVFGERFADLIRLVTVRSLGSMTERLAYDLLERACQTQLLEGRLLYRVTHEQLAHSIGSTREVVTRLLGELRRAGILTTSPGRISVEDPQRLSAIVRGLVA